MHNMRDIRTKSDPRTTTGNALVRTVPTYASIFLATVVLAAVLLAGCSGGGESKPTIDAGPIRAAQPMHVFASQTFRPLMTLLGPMFERDHPEFDLVVTYGNAHPPLDSDQDLQEMIGDGAQLDVFLAGDAIQVSQISREPISVVSFVGNRIVLIRPTGSRLRLIDLSSGTCEVAVALERTPLGRASRQTLQARGIWSDLAERVGLFTDAQAIMTRVGSPGLEPLIGVVYASSARTGDLPLEIVAALDGSGGTIEHLISVWSTEGRVFSQWLGTQTAQDAARRAGFVTQNAVESESSAESQKKP